MMKDHLIYRLMPPGQWEMALASGSLPYNVHDERDGFMHISAPHQMLDTANKHYTDFDELVAVGLDPEALGPDLKWEPSRGGDLFPHFYGFVPTEQTVHRLAVKKQDDGTFDVAGELG